MGCVGVQGPAGPCTQPPPTPLPKPKTRAEIQQAMSIQKIINKIGKGTDSDPKYFCPSEYANTCDFFIFVNGAGDLKTTTFESAGIYYPYTVPRSFTDRASYSRDVFYTTCAGNSAPVETCQTPHDLANRLSNSTRGPDTLYHLVGWMSRLTNISTDLSWLPPMDISVQNFETQDDYNKHVQAEQQKKIDTETEWKRKYSIDTNLYIAPGVCEWTGVKTTCVVVENESDSDDDCCCDHKKSHTVSLEYPNYKAKQMQP